MTTPTDLHREVSAGRIKAAYYFFGTEDYRITEAEKYVARQFLPDRQLSTNYYRLDARRTSCAELMMQLQSLPLLGERQVFIVTNFQHYAAKEVERILSLLSPPPPDRVIVLSSPGSKPPRKTTAFFKALSKATVTVEFRRLGGGQAERIVRTNLERANLSIEPEAATLLVDLVAGNRGALENETAKLISYKQPGETVSVDDVRTVAAGHAVFNVFEVADFVATRNTQRLLPALENLLAGGNSPATLIILLMQHFISLYLVKNGKQPLGRRGFLIPKLEQQASRYTEDRLEDIIKQIAETESEMRRGGLKPEMALQVLVLSLAGDPGRSDG